MKIAIIDDDPVCHFLHSKLIERVSGDHQISSYSNGSEAIEHILLNATRPQILPELILLDINMPNMNGWQFLAKLRLIQVDGYCPRIYLVSSSTDVRDSDKALEFSELQGFLHKPITKIQIVQLLNEAPAKAEPLSPAAEY